MGTYPRTRFHTRSTRLGAGLGALVMRTLLPTWLTAGSIALLILRVALQSTLVLAVEQPFARVSSVMGTHDLPLWRDLGRLLIGEDATTRTGGLARLSAALERSSARFQTENGAWILMTGYCGRMLAPW